jgi:hypothetical protein
MPIMNNTIAVINRVLINRQPISKSKWPIVTSRIIFKERCIIKSSRATGGGQGAGIPPR